MTHSTVFERIHPGLQKLISESDKWKHGLRDVQLSSIPLILEGQDCIIEAPTAGGKTEAVLFPALTRVSETKEKAVQILYLAPLRALLNNIETRAYKYAEACGLHAFKWHGDVDQKKKIDELLDPSQLLLTTPESLEAILLRKAGWVQFFSSLEFIIIDEAHNFASCDRGNHLIALLERIEHAIGRAPQRIAVTATVGNPEGMLRWLAGSKRKLGKRIHVGLDKQKEKDIQILFFDDSKDDDAPPEELSNYLAFTKLYDLLPGKKSIVFTGSRRETESLATAVNKKNSLTSTRNPVNVRTHHSAVSKYYREEAEKLIQIASESGLEAIMSTSTLELGIDIGELERVINVGSLSSPSAFLQRIGRTGRKSGIPQFFRGFCTSREDLILLTAVVSLGLRGVTESINFPRKAFHLLAHQLICLSLQNNGIQAPEAWRILSNAYCFSDITESKFNDLVQFMIQERYLRDVDGSLVVGEECERTFLGSKWRRLFAVFDSGPMYDVLDGKNHVGTLDSAFVEALKVPFLFVLGGIEWKAVKINTRSRHVIAQKTRFGEAPRWMVFRGLDVPLETAKEVARLLFTSDLPWFLNDAARDGIIEARNQFSGVPWQEGKWVITTSNSGKANIWTFAGDRINRTLAKLFTLVGIGKAVCSYKQVKIEDGIKDQNKLATDIHGSIEKLAACDRHQLMDLEDRLSTGLKRIPFSKFAKCLPKHIWSEAMGERVLDLGGLKNELIRNSIEFTSRFQDVIEYKS